MPFSAMCPEDVNLQRWQRYAAARMSKRMPRRVSPTSMYSATRMICVMYFSLSASLAGSGLGNKRYISCTAARIKYSRLCLGGARLSNAVAVALGKKGKVYQSFDGFSDGHVSIRWCFPAKLLVVVLGSLLKQLPINVAVIEKGERVQKHIR
jgi:hypothetical protein